MFYAGRKRKRQEKVEASWEALNTAANELEASLSSLGEMADREVKRIETLERTVRYVEGTLIELVKTDSNVLERVESLERILGGFVGAYNREGGGAGEDAPIFPQ